MLEQLTVRNVALLEEASLAPSPRLTVISGETGGGKTLVVLALRMLRGERIKAEVVRHGARAATVDGVFRLTAGERSDRVRELYEEVLATAPEDDRIVVTRVLDRSGKSRARVDGRPVTMQALQAFGALLIEIHGQGANGGLMRPEVQTELADAFAGVTADRRAFAVELREARELDRRLEALRAGKRERRERAEFLRFCLDEIARVEPKQGEHEELMVEARVLGRLDDIRAVLQRGSALLDGGDDGPAYSDDGERTPPSAPVLDTVAKLARDIGDLSADDPRLEAPARLLEEALVLLGEASRELSSGLSRLDLDPARHEIVEQRLHELERLLERFGPTEAELLAQRTAMREELATLTDPAACAEALEDELASRTQELEQRGAALTKARHTAARKLATLVLAELAGLGMPRTRIEIRVRELDGPSLLARASELGTSEIEIFLAPNPGEPMSALRETASGGEVARVMLVLKKVLADNDHVPLLVFDEADAEIGGRLGLAVGRKLAELGASHQVICVTHQPQIAAFADVHYLVAKSVAERDEGTRTVASLRRLEATERARELACMAHGEAIDDAAMREAARLLESARGS